MASRAVSLIDRISNQALKSCHNVNGEQRVGAPAARQNLVSLVPKYAPINRLLESLAYNPGLIYLQAAEEEAENSARARAERSGQPEPVRARLASHALVESLTQPFGVSVWCEKVEETARE
jgi:hypothetical protein